MLGVLVNLQHKGQCSKKLVFSTSKMVVKDWQPGLKLGFLSGEFLVEVQNQCVDFGTHGQHTCIGKPRRLSAPCVLLGLSPVISQETKIQRGKMFIAQHMSNCGKVCKHNVDIKIVLNLLLIIYFIICYNMCVCVCVCVCVCIHTYNNIHWRRKWQPTPVFLLGKIQWTEAPLEGYSSRGH